MENKLNITSHAAILEGLDALDSAFSAICKALGSLNVTIGDILTGYSGNIPGSVLEATSLPTGESVLYLTLDAWDMVRESVQSILSEGETVACRCVTLANKLLEISFRFHDTVFIVVTEKGELEERGLLELFDVPGSSDVKPMRLG